MRDYIGWIRATGAPTPEIIDSMIQEHRGDHERMKWQYERYRVEDEAVPILTRQLHTNTVPNVDSIHRIDTMVNNTLNNTFDSEIVDNKIGYMFGIPITYDVDKNATAAEKLKELLKTFNLRNTVEDKDSEWAKKAAICGYGVRLCYIDTETNERIMNVNPWEVMILSEVDDIAEPTYALRYFEQTRYDGETIQVACFYDDKYYYRFEAALSNDYELVDKKLHMFEYCPLFGLANNDELLGDAEKVYNLIDAYDRTLSDASNEIEQYRLAYLVLKGLGLSEEAREQLKHNGIFELFGEGDDVKYLTKDINDALIEHHLDRLEENILRLAKSVNFGDGTFGTSITGVALRYKLMAMESKCMMMERKAQSALRYQAKVLCSSWKRRNAIHEDDYLQIFTTFTRNVPVDLLNEAQTTVALQGAVSERTRLAALPIVDDVDYELEEMKKDAEMMEPQEPYMDDDPDDEASKDEDKDDA